MEENPSINVDGVWMVIGKEINVAYYPPLMSFDEQEVIFHF